jgi:hypothetical protein
MKNWLFVALIFFLSFSALAEWQFLLTPKQEKITQFCSLGYAWEVEPFVISLHGGLGMMGDCMVLQRNIIVDDENTSFQSISYALLPAVTVRLEQYTDRKVAPYAQFRYSQALTFGGSHLDFSWVPDKTEPDLEAADVTEIWEFFRLGGGVRYKWTEHLSLLGDYGLEATFLKNDVFQYEKQQTTYEEFTRRLWFGTYGGLSLVWHW